MLLVGWQEEHSACKTEWWDVGVVICWGWGADLMPLPLTISCSTHTHTTVLRLCGICPGQPGWAGTISLAPVNPYWSYLPGFTFSVPVHPGSPGQNTKSRKMVVVVVVIVVVIFVLFTRSTILQLSELCELGELVPEGTFCHVLDFLVQNGDNTGRHTNNPDGLPWCPHFCHATIFAPDALPGTTSKFILAWDRHQICWLAYPVTWFAYPVG